MTVYIDDSRVPHGRMRTAHMTADTDVELHAVAARLGLKRRWFQDRDPAHGHYDICQAKREAALRLHGAVAVDRRTYAAMIQCRRLDPVAYRRALPDPGEARALSVTLRRDRNSRRAA